jgi:hypothetical protein
MPIEGSYMAQEFKSYRLANDAAREQSIKNPGVAVHVNWIEGDYWEVSIFAEMQDQDYWLNGQKFYPDSEEN